jgi:hypothetical protein
MVTASGCPPTRISSGSSAASRSARGSAVAWPSGPAGTVTRTTRRRAVLEVMTASRDVALPTSLRRVAGRQGAAAWGGHPPVATWPLQSFFGLTTPTRLCREEITCHLVQSPSGGP